MSWKDGFLQVASDVEGKFDELRYRFYEKMNAGGPVMILPYRGFGTRTRIHLQGRVLEDNGLRGTTDNDTLWDNLLAAYRRVESDELPGVQVGIRYGRHEAIVAADHEGFFKFSLEVSEGLPTDRLHHEVELWLPEEVRGQTGVTATGQVVIPPVESSYGIISDIDDTILLTDATNLLAAARLTFTQNSRSRKPFEGVAALYRALQVGPDGTNTNPIFFVSSGPWNLYDLLVEFMEHNDIPSGPIFLQDYGIEPDKLIYRDHHDHKLTAIERVLSTYPDLSFILIGDSGQKDPEIYSRVVEDFPGRVKAIYIRDVTVGPRSEEIIGLADRLRVGNVPMVLAPDSRAAAHHAAEHGLIRPEEEPAIEEETEGELGIEN